jgi:hypothetical protein
MTADLGITHSATLWLELHFENAIPEARRMATEMHSRGNLDGADTWLKVIVALEDLRNASNHPRS